MEFATICVLGLGYIGLPTASTFASNGLRVLGVDVNAQVLKVLENGGIHIQEPGLRSLVETAFRSGNLRLGPRPEPANAFIIAVPTPILEDKRADMQAVTSAADRSSRTCAPATWSSSNLPLLRARRSTWSARSWSVPV